MDSQYAQSNAQAHSLIAQNLHCCMRLVEKFGETLRWTTIRDIRAVGDDLLRYGAANDGEGLEYENYRDAISKAARLTSGVCGAMLHDSVLDQVALWIDALSDEAEAIETNVEGIKTHSGLIPVINVAKEMEKLREELASLDEGDMTPLTRLNHNRDLQSLGAGLDAVAQTKDLVAELHEDKPDSITVSGLNVEVVNEATLRSWMIAMGNKGALPKKPDIILSALDRVEKYRHADRETKEQLFELWSAATPAVESQSLETAIGAIMESAASTRLESLDHSAVDAVREITRSVYEELELRAAFRHSEANPGAGRADIEEVNALAPLLESLNDQLVKIDFNLAYGVGKSTVEDLRRTIDRVGSKIEALIEKPEPDHIEPGPGA